MVLIEDPCPIIYPLGFVRVWSGARPLLVRYSSGLSGWCPCLSGSCPCLSLAVRGTSVSGPGYPGVVRESSGCGPGVVRLCPAVSCSVRVWSGTRPGHVRYSSVSRPGYPGVVRGLSGYPLVSSGKSFPRLLPDHPGSSPDHSRTSPV